MNNFPECFPTSALLQLKLNEYYKKEPKTLKDYSEEDNKPIVWGLTDWEFMFYEPKNNDE